MSIIVNSLSKIYGAQKALDAISFSVNEGEILGFLGPNGAGKSTTMKIATGFLPPTSGSVRVGDFDVVEKPVAVKKIVGYLPENNPLYTDMYVHEYLRFIGSLHGMQGRRLKERTDEIVKLCGLDREQLKKIGALSKGYRQRVGLAQALIHDPKVIILDEPTTGLDPNQILEIRELIRQVSKNKTVVFSTHIMQEVQALCSRVVIINKGKIVADKAVAALRSDHLTEKHIVVEFAQDIATQELENIEGVQAVKSLGNSKYSILVSGEQDIRGEIFNFASRKNIALLGLTQEESNLEDIFQKLTK